MRYYKNSLASSFGRDIKKLAPGISQEKIEKFRTYAGVLLGILGVAGLVTMAVLAPNALQALDIFEKRRGNRRLPPKTRERKVLRTFYYLKAKGAIEIRRGGTEGQYEIFLTRRGRKMVKELRLETLSIKRPGSWDGKFWQVAADIPTKDYRRGADALRSKLREMKFYPLQRTLWFYPYDPRVELQFIAQMYGIAPFVTVMKIEETDPSDGKVLNRFFKEQGIV